MWIHIVESFIQLSLSEECPAQSLKIFHNRIINLPPPPPPLTTPHPYQFKITYSVSWLLAC